MQTPTTDPRRAIAQHLAGELTGTALLRIFMSHPGWRVPIVMPAEAGLPPRAVVRKNQEGKRFFQLFSDEQAVKDCVSQTGPQGDFAHFLETPGHAAFSFVDEELDFVDINPLSQPEVHYRKEQVPTLKKWAQAVGIEQVLATLDDSEAAFSRIKHHTPFYLVANQVGDEMSLVMAPDDERRRLAAVFTADDAREAFLAQAVPALRIEPRILALSGQELCEMLADVPLEGIVFNCLGPIRPAAFTAELIRLVLAAP